MDLFKTEYAKYNDDLLFGRTQHKDIWDKLCVGINKEINIQILYNSYINTPINKEIHELIKKIKDKGYKTAMVTDNKKDRMESIVKHYDLMEAFDEVIVSAEVGAGKDDEEIFKKTIQKLNVKPGECVFIDNQKKNLVVPKAMGMMGIFYDHEENDVGRLIKELNNLGVEV